MRVSFLAMLGEVLTQRRALAVRVLSFSLFGAVGAAHAVSQPPPDSTPLPLPVPTAETTVILSRSFPESAVTLPGLFQFRSESIDPSAVAAAARASGRALAFSSSFTRLGAQAGSVEVASATAASW